MGCGKSKHDVASGNTVMQSSASRKIGQEYGTEIKDIVNNNVDNVSSGVQVEQKESVSVKVSDNAEVKHDEVVKDVKAEGEKKNVHEENDIEKTNVQEEKEVEPEDREGKIQEIPVVAEQFQSEKSEGGKDDLLKENEQKNIVGETANATYDKMLS